MLIIFLSLHLLQRNRLSSAKVSIVWFFDVSSSLSNLGPRGIRQKNLQNWDSMNQSGTEWKLISCYVVGIRINYLLLLFGAQGNADTCSVVEIAPPPIKRTSPPLLWFWASSLFGGDGIGSAELCVLLFRQHSWLFLIWKTKTLSQETIFA